MRPNVVVYSTILLKEVFIFQCQVLALTPKLGESVWFEEPEKFNHRLYSKQSQMPHSLRKTPFDQSLEEMVWFDLQEYMDHDEPKHTIREILQNKVGGEEKESKGGVSDRWRNENGILAKYILTTLTALL